MRALTIYQPWASLIAVGAKTYETRSWATRHRGPIAIHAGKKIPSTIMCATDIPYIIPAIGRAFGIQEKPIINIIEYLDSLPLGAVIATAELVGCHRIVRYGGRGCASTDPGWLVSDDGQIYEPTEQEILFGDWTPGRYAWELANMTLLPEPIPATGRQGLWNWEMPSRI